LLNRFFLKYFLIIIDGIIDILSSSVYSRELEKYYYKYHYLITNRIAYGISIDYMEKFSREIPTE